MIWDLLDIRHATWSLIPRGYVSPAIARGEQTLAQTADAMGVGKRRLQRWATRWLEIGVQGVRRVPCGCAGGHAFVFDDGFVERWLNCEIPSPHE